MKKVSAMRISVLPAVRLRHEDVMLLRHPVTTNCRSAATRHQTTDVL